MVLSFLPKYVRFISKNAISCLFLKNVSPQFRPPLTLCVLILYSYSLMSSPNDIFFCFEKIFMAVLFTLMCFLFYQKSMHFVSKNPISCLFLKNVSSSKRVVCFILNNLHFPMVEGIAFYALYKSRVLIISCKAEDFCLFIGLPNEI